MENELNFDLTRFENALVLLASYSAKDAKSVFVTACKGIISNCYAITPPAKGKGAKEKNVDFDRDAIHHGRLSIDRDLRAIFKPVTIKGTRTIRKVFGKTISSPVTVRTVEKHPDVEAIYTTRNGARGGHGKLKRGQKAAYYVDKSKYSALASKLYLRVGWAAAGFNVAAQTVGARIPSYAKGKGAPGASILTLDTTTLRFKFENAVGYVDALKGLRGKIQKAIEYQTDAMLRQMPFVIKAAAKRSGFKIAA